MLFIAEASFVPESLLIHKTNQYLEEESLRECIIKRDATQIQNLIKQGVNPNIRYEDKKTALHFACTLKCKAISEMCIKMAIIRVLLKHDANHRLLDCDSQNPLYYLEDYERKQLPWPYQLSYWWRSKL